MILCDMDGVLATGPARDTAPGKPIYRTFTRVPGELERIKAAGIPFHVVTAKVEAEARQVLEAVGLEGYVESVIGADQLFWPSVWGAIRRGRIPRSVVKSVYRSVLPRPEAGRVVMLEDRRRHLLEMLEAGAIDFGILVPRISSAEGRIVDWFDLDLALRIARELVLEGLDAGDLSKVDFTARRWTSGGLEDGDPREFDAPSHGTPLDEERYLLRLPTVRFEGAEGSGPGLERLDTGRRLKPAQGTVVTMVRAALRVVRRTVGRLPASG